MITENMVEAAALAMVNAVRKSEGERLLLSLDDFPSPDLYKWHMAIARETLEAAFAGNADVAVRELEWEGCVATTPFGPYTVVENSDDLWQFTFHCYPYGTPNDQVFATDAEAKSAAQADYARRIRSALIPGHAEGYQARVHKWMLACFNDEIAFSRQERNHRFLEEALELVQSLGCTKHEVGQLVDYVFGREIGDPNQEVGGVEVCLAALCTAADINMEAARERELTRVWTKVEKIRAKHAAKPKFSPLPGSVAAPLASIDGGE